MRSTGPMRAVAALLLAVHLGGCVTWGPLPDQPLLFIDEYRPVRVRLTYPDGERKVLDYPIVVGDSILGSDARGERTPISAENLVIEIKQMNTVRTVLFLGIVIPTVAFASVYAICAGTRGPCNLGFGTGSFF